jgi:hypothetical protein
VLPGESINKYNLIGNILAMALRDLKNGHPLVPVLE